MNFAELLQSSNEFLGIDIFDKDFYKLVFLFLINFVVTFTLIRFIYYPFSNKKKEYLFSFILISTIIFFIAFSLKSFKFNTGIAIGLFAVFGIIRFRTSTVPVKEMTYLFTILGLSLVNALSNKLSLIEVALIDGSVLLITLFMELLLKRNKKIETIKPKTIDLIYGNLENLKPHNKELLFSDLTNETGLTITAIKTISVNLKNKEANLKIYYTEQNKK